jgi:hypothetical protein
VGLGLDCGEVVGGGRLDEDIALGVGEEGLGVERGRWGRIGWFMRLNEVLAVNSCVFLRGE